VKKFRGAGSGKAFPCPGDGKNLLAKRALISSLPEGIKLILGRTKNHLVFTWFAQLVCVPSAELW
jgi:hypothetical protein